MNSDDFAYIESALQVVLPAIFTEFMRQFPNDRTHQLESEFLDDGLPTNAQLFVVYQHERWGVGDEEYEGQPELRDRRFISLGWGPSGIFFMVGNDADSNELWHWDNGGFACLGQKLAEFLARWKLVDQPDPFGKTPSGATVITRADHPRCSILNPISLDEWKSCVAASAHLELDEHATATNPYTGESTSFHFPGRAKVLSKTESGEIKWHENGSVVLQTSDGQAPRQLRSAMQSIADDLGADLF